MNLTIIGRRIRENRVRMRLSQAELAEMIDLSAYHIGSIENGKKGPSLDALIKIADALDISTDSLLIGYRKSNPSPYADNIMSLLNKSSHYERNILLKVIFSIHSALEESRWLMEDNENDT